jgi:hypothetical protein
MQLTSALYRKSVVIFGGFVVLVGWGFWSTYYSNPLAMTAQGPSVSLVHLHGLAMTLWCLMLCTQAYLIRTGRRSWHRAVGKASYGLAPLVIALQVMVMANFVPTQANLVDQGVVSDRGAVFMSLLLGMTAMFSGLYALAIYHRRNAAIHARLMVATALTVLAPATDRIVNTYFPTLTNYLPQVHKNEMLVAFLIADLLLIGLSIWDWRSRPRLKVFPIVLLAMLGYQAFTINAYRVAPWKELCQWFLRISGA